MTEPEQERTEAGVPARGAGSQGEQGVDLKRTALDGARREPKADREAIFGIESVDVAYSGNPAVRDITFDIRHERDHGADRSLRAAARAPCCAASTG